MCNKLNYKNYRGNEIYGAVYIKNKCKILIHGGNMDDFNNYFDGLYQLNFTDSVKKKKNLNYLPWSKAWAELKKLYPDANYAIHKFGENSLPYILDEDLGYMVSTEVTINGVTHEMMLAVMDTSNRAMKNRDYTYKTRAGENTVSAASMCDIARTIMRCLTKNIAMHGLGLYLYEAEELPEAIRKLAELQDECWHLLQTKSKLSDKAKAEVKKVCEDADEIANGNPKLITDKSALEKLKLQLLAIRK